MKIITKFTKASFYGIVTGLFLITILFGKNIKDTSGSAQNKNNPAEMKKIKIVWQYADKINKDPYRKLNVENKTKNVESILDKQDRNKSDN